MASRNEVETVAEKQPILIIFKLPIGPGGGGHISPRPPMVSGTSCVVIQVGSSVGRPTTTHTLHTPPYPFPTQPSPSTHQPATMSNSFQSSTTSDSSINLPSPSFQRPISFPSLSFLSSAYGPTQTRALASSRGSLSLSQGSNSISSASSGGISDSNALAMASKNIIKGPRDSFNKFGSVKFAKRNRRTSPSSGGAAAASGSDVKPGDVDGGLGHSGPERSGHGVPGKSGHSGTDRSGYDASKPGHGRENQPGNLSAQPLPKPRTLSSDRKLHTVDESQALSSSAIIEGSKTRHRLELKLDLKPVYEKQENASHLPSAKENNSCQPIPDVVSMTQTERKLCEKKLGVASGKNVEHGKPKFKINSKQSKHGQQVHSLSSPGTETNRQPQNSVKKDLGTGGDFTARKHERTLPMFDDAEWPTLQSAYLVKSVNNMEVEDRHKPSFAKGPDGVIPHKNMSKMTGDCEKSSRITKTDPQPSGKSVPSSSSRSSSSRTHSQRSTGSTNPLHAELMSKYNSSSGGKVSRLRKVKTKEPKTVQELFSGYKFNVCGDSLMDFSQGGNLKTEQSVVVRDLYFGYTSADVNKEKRVMAKYIGGKDMMGKDPVPVKPERHVKKQLMTQEEPEPHKRIRKLADFTEASLCQGPSGPTATSGSSKAPEHGLRSRHASLRVPRKALGDDGSSFNRGAALRKSYSKVVCIVNL